MCPQTQHGRFLGCELSVTALSAPGPRAATESANTWRQELWMWSSRAWMGTHTCSFFVLPFTSDAESQTSAAWFAATPVDLIQPEI